MTTLWSVTMRLPSFNQSSMVRAVSLLCCGDCNEYLGSYCDMLSLLTVATALGFYLTGQFSLITAG